MDACIKAEECRATETLFFSKSYANGHLEIASMPHGAVTAISDTALTVADQLRWTHEIPCVMLSGPMRKEKIQEKKKDVRIFKVPRCNKTKSMRHEASLYTTFMRHEEAPFKVFCRKRCSG